MKNRAWDNRNRNGRAEQMVAEMANTPPTRKQFCRTQVILAKRKHSMGGPGSGKGQRWNAKTCVESCLILDVSKISLGEALRAGTKGTIRWTDEYTGKSVSAVGFSTFVSCIGERLLTLLYRFAGSHHQSVEDISIDIHLTETRPHYGGVRWWFRCPLVDDNIPCDRRVAKLYLPPGGRHFGCRTCHNLTYRSCQEAHS